MWCLRPDRTHADQQSVSSVQQVWGSEGGASSGRNDSGTGRAWTGSARGSESCRCRRDETEAEQVSYWTVSYLVFCGFNVKWKIVNIRDCEWIWAASWQNQQSDCASSEDSDQPGHPPILIRVFALHSMGSQGPKVSSCGQRRLWSDWADAQADLSLRWAHSHFVGFVMRRLIFWFLKLFWIGNLHAENSL